MQKTTTNKGVPHLGSVTFSAISGLGQGVMWGGLSLIFSQAPKVMKVEGYTQAKLGLLALGLFLSYRTLKKSFEGAVEFNRQQLRDRWAARGMNEQELTRAAEGLVIRANEAYLLAMTVGAGAVLTELWK